MRSQKTCPLLFGFLVCLLKGGGSSTEGVKCGLEIIETRCEYALNPVGIETEKPRFTWVLSSRKRGDYQRAYRILVASSMKNIENDIGHKWDSARVESSNSVNVPYGGKELRSTERYYWKVKVWDSSGRSSEWSRISVSSSTPSLLRLR